MNTIAQFVQVSSTIGAVKGAAGPKTAELKKYLEEEKQIPICTVQTHAMPEWEKLSIFLGFLIPKLPALEDENLARGIQTSV